MFRSAVVLDWFLIALCYFLAFITFLIFSVLLLSYNNSKDILKVTTCPTVLFGLVPLMEFACQKKPIIKITADNLNEWVFLYGDQTFQAS